MIKAKEQAKSKLTGRQIEHLLYGFSLEFASKDCPWGPFESDEHRRAAWFENREWLMSFEGKERIPGVFGSHPIRPGKKPAAMLEYE